MWFKVDDKLHDHRKARHVRRSHSTKRRDVAPFGIWALAGSWCGANRTGGFVPLEVLEEMDDDAEQLADRLVAAGLWSHDKVDEEPGYRFHDWADQNPNGEDPGDYGRRGNHIRWHASRGVIDPNCDLCRPDDRPDIPPDDRPDIPRDHHGDIRVDSSRPDPTRPDPTRPDPISGAPTAEAAVPDEPGPTKTRKKPAKPFPPDFHPSQQHIDLARELNVDLRCEFEQFRDYWISEGRPKADWDATLRNWIRKARGNVRPLPIQMNGGRPFIPLAPDDKR
jgi:hypothetical protein